MANPSVDFLLLSVSSTQRLRVQRHLLALRAPEKKAAVSMTAALAISTFRLTYLSLPDFCFESFFSEDGCTGGLVSGFGPDRGG